MAGEGPREVLKLAAVAALEAAAGAGGLAAYQARPRAVGPAGNAFENHAVGVDLGAGQRGVTILANSFTSVAAPVGGQATPTTTVQEDAWSEGSASTTDRLLSTIRDLDARLRRLESG